MWNRFSCPISHFHPQEIHVSRNDDSTNTRNVLYLWILISEDSWALSCTWMKRSSTSVYSQQRGHTLQCPNVRCYVGKICLSNKVVLSRAQSITVCQKIRQKFPEITDRFQSAHHFLAACWTLAVLSFSICLDVNCSFFQCFRDVYCTWQFIT